MLICEEGIFVLEAQSTFSIPHTIKTKNVTTGNQTNVKSSMYCTNYYRTNHNIKTCKSKEEPIVAATKANTQVNKTIAH
jgi:hypothetical protein